MTQKIKILAMVFLALGLAMAGIGGASAAHAATAPAQLSWSPTTSSGTYDYGTLDAGAGQTKAVTFTLANAGGMASGALAITLPGSAAFTITQDGCTGRSLGPKKSCTVTVEYAPTSSGQSDSATLTATGEHASATLTLTGKSLTPTPNLTFNPDGYKFGPVASATQTFTITNSGTGSSEPLILSGFDTYFTLSNDSCTNTSLVPHGTCTFDVSATSGAGCTGKGRGDNILVSGSDPLYILYNVMSVEVMCP
jgi:hypothetical protein